MKLERMKLKVHAHKFSMILTELSTLNMKIKKEGKVLLLLASLHASYDHIVITLLFEKDILKHDKVNAILLLNESRRKSCNDDYLQKIEYLVILMVGDE